MVALAREVYDESLALANLRSRNIELELSDEPLPVMADAAHISEAMTNLISNAIKYTPADGRIVVRVHCRRSKVLFEVEDNGPGIPEEKQERLFEPFYRAVKSSEVEGSGLGLHLVRNIIQRYGGKTHFSSVYGKGSLFGFSLPLVDDLEHT